MWILSLNRQLCRDALLCAQLKLFNNVYFISEKIQVLWNLSLHFFEVVSRHTCASPCGEVERRQLFH